MTGREGPGPERPGPATPPDVAEPDEYDRACADERARIVWWLRAGADGPASVSRPDEAAFAAALADVIEAHPERFADAPVPR